MHPCSPENVTGCDSLNMQNFISAGLPESVPHLFRSVHILFWVPSSQQAVNSVQFQFGTHPPPPPPPLPHWPQSAGHEEQLSPEPLSLFPHCAEHLPQSDWQEE